jgi:hypothetical protein
MSTELSQVVALSISANSKTPTREGFGIPLFLSYHTVFPERFRRYEDLAGMISDGFALTSVQCKGASAFFSQDPAPAAVIIGRLPAAPATTWAVTVTSAVQGAHVKLTVVSPDGTVTPIDYTILAAATTTTVATALELLIEACPGVDSVSSGAVITATPTTSGERFWLFGESNCQIKNTTADAGYATELAALQIENDDWYFVTIDDSSAANIAAVAAWTLTQKKIFFTATNASDELSGTGTVGSALKALSNDRAVVLYAPNASQYAGAAWVGVGAPQDPGSITWAFKSLAGVSPASLTSTQRSNLETDNINHYQTLAGLPVTRQGVTAQGEFIDIRHGIDALEARIQEDVFALLANAKKIPFTALGLDMIANAILGAMKAFEGSDEQPGLLVRGSSVVRMPDINAISDADKASRRLTGVKFSATLAGAVHYVSIVGTLSV